MARTRPALSLVERRPVSVRAGVVAVVGLLASFGLRWAVDLTEAQLGYLVTIVVVASPFVQGLWTRLAVVSKAKVINQVTDDGAVISGDAAVEATGENAFLIDKPGSQPPVAISTVRPELVADDAPRVAV